MLVHTCHCIFILWCFVLIKVRRGFKLELIWYWLWKILWKLEKKKRKGISFSPSHPFWLLAHPLSAARSALLLPQPKPPPFPFSSRGPAPLGPGTPRASSLLRSICVLQVWNVSCIHLHSCCWQERDHDLLLFLLGHLTFILGYYLYIPYCTNIQGVLKCVQPHVYICLYDTSTCVTSNLYHILDTSQCKTSSYSCHLTKTSILLDADPQNACSSWAVAPHLLESNCYW